MAHSHEHLPSYVEILSSPATSGGLERIILRDPLFKPDGALVPRLGQEGRSRWKAITGYSAVTLKLAYPVEHAGLQTHLMSNGFLGTRSP